jgi:hypothetical protein
LIPEETNPTQKTPEEPLAPTPVPAPETVAPGEPLDASVFTPPHGDPLGDVALDPAPAEPPDDGVFTPPHGAPLGHVALDPAPAEPLDDGEFTPPHGDPLGDAALAPPPSFEATLVEPVAGEAAPDAFTDSTPVAAFTVEEPLVAAPSAPELLYSGPVEPAPAGAWIGDPEPERMNAEPVLAVPVAETAATAENWTAPDEHAAVGTVEVTSTGIEHDQPELLYSGPVEPAPAGFYLSESATNGGVGEEGSTPDPSPVQPIGELHDDLEAAALAAEATPQGDEPPVEPEPPIDGGPNWMLAFICAWSSAISLREAWVTLGGGGFGMILHNLGVLGYLLLGVGLLAFAFDALRWGQPRRNVGALVIPTLLTLAGVICLVLWSDRGRPI